MGRGVFDAHYTTIVFLALFFGGRDIFRRCGPSPGVQDKRGSQSKLRQERHDEARGKIGRAVHEPDFEFPPGQLHGLH